MQREVTNMSGGRWRGGGAWHLGIKVCLKGLRKEETVNADRRVILGLLARLEAHLPPKGVGGRCLGVHNSVDTAKAPRQTETKWPRNLAQGHFFSLTYVCAS